MKKYIILYFSHLLIIPQLQSMELALPPQKQQQEYNEKCDRVARYFLKKVATGTINLFDAFVTFAQLDKPVKELIRNGSLTKEQSPFIMLLTVPKDIFTHMAFVVLPHYEKKEKVKFHSSRHPIVLLTPEQQNNEECNELISTESLINDFFNLSVPHALSIFTRFLNRKHFSIDDMIESPSSQCSISSSNFYYDDDDSGKTYSLSLSDLITITAEQEELLNTMVDKHTKSVRIGKRDLRHKVMEQDKQLLKPLKTFINRNELFKNCCIGIDCKSRSLYEKIKDKLLLAIPLTVFSYTLPDTVHHCINGKLQGCIGFIATGLGGLIFGEWGYPLFDSFNSGSIRLKQWFGTHNKTKIKRGYAFAAISLFHYFFTAIAYQCLHSAMMPVQIIGYALHGIRGCAYLCGLFDMRSYVERKNFFIQLLPELCHLESYQNILLRRNKDDKSYTLGDLVNSPHF